MIARPLGVDVVARRILRANWRGIVMGHDARHSVASSRIPGQILDRVCPLIAIMPPGQEALMQSGVSELLVSFGARTLQRDASALSVASRRAIGYVLVELARYYGQCGRANAPLPPTSRLSSRIDAAVRTLPAIPGLAEGNVLASLVVIRLALFPAPSNLQED